MNLKKILSGVAAFTILCNMMLGGYISEAPVKTVNAVSYSSKYDEEVGKPLIYERDYPGYLSFKTFSMTRSCEGALRYHVYFYDGTMIIEGYIADDVAAHIPKESYELTFEKAYSDFDIYAYAQSTKIKSVTDYFTVSNPDEFTAKNGPVLFEYGTYLKETTFVSDETLTSRAGELLWTYRIDINPEAFSEAFTPVIYVGRTVINYLQNIYKSGNPEIYEKYKPYIEYKYIESGSPAQVAERDFVNTKSNSFGMNCYFEDTDETVFIDDLINAKTVIIGNAGREPRFGYTFYLNTEGSLKDIAKNHTGSIKISYPKDNSVTSGNTLSSSAYISDNIINTLNYNYNYNANDYSLKKLVLTKPEKKSQCIDGYLRVDYPNRSDAFGALRNDNKPVYSEELTNADGDSMVYITESDKYYLSDMLVENIEDVINIKDYLLGSSNEGCLSELIKDFELFYSSKTYEYAREHYKKDSTYTYDGFGMKTDLSEILDASSCVFYAGKLYYKKSVTVDGLCADSISNYPDLSELIYLDENDSNVTRIKDLFTINYYISDFGRNGIDNKKTSYRLMVEILPNKSITDGKYYSLVKDDSVKECEKIYTGYSDYECTAYKIKNGSEAKDLDAHNNSRRIGLHNEDAEPSSVEMTLVDGARNSISVSDPNINKMLNGKSTVFHMVKGQYFDDKNGILGRYFYDIELDDDNADTLKYNIFGQEFSYNELIGSVGEYIEPSVPDDKNTDTENNNVVTTTVTETTTPVTTTKVTETTTPVTTKATETTTPVTTKATETTTPVTTTKVTETTTPGNKDENNVVPQGMKYQKSDDGTIKITRYSGSETDVVIPKTIDGKKVTGISRSAFADCTTLKSITLPDSIKSISAGAFLNCTSLRSVTLPDSITIIEDGAFGHCDDLKSITIPESVISIGDDAFWSCDSLTSIIIPESVKSIGERAFKDCSNLKSITIPDSVTSIGDEAFIYCDELVIYGYENSYAQKYAAENYIKFKAVPKPVIVLGDINFDGIIDLTDLTELSLVLLNDKIISASGLKAADIDGNGEVDITDLARMKQYISKFITSLE